MGNDSYVLLERHPFLQVANRLASSFRCFLYLMRAARFLPTLQPLAYISGYSTDRTGVLH